MRAGCAGGRSARDGAPAARVGHQGCVGGECERGGWPRGRERAVSKLSELSNLPANASKVEIKNAIKKYALELKTSKEQLTNMVPYRALAGFFDRAEEPADWGSVRRMTEYIERINEHVVILPYTLGTGSKLKKEIYFQPSWTKMIQDNTVSILGWIQYEKVKWLQNNNPEVPSLVYKLAPMDEKMRKLNHVRKLWEGILELTEVRDVFTGEVVAPKAYDVDHFIPWSFRLQPAWLCPRQRRLPRVERRQRDALLRQRGRSLPAFVLL